MEFVKNTPFFKTKFEDNFCNQTSHHHHFCTFNRPLMLQKSLGYAIKQFQRFYRVPEKIVIFKKITKFEPWTWSAIVLSKTFFDTILWLSLQRLQKKPGFYIIVYWNVWLVYWTGVNITTYGKLSCVPLNILSSVLFSNISNAKVEYFTRSLWKADFSICW